MSFLLFPSFFRPHFFLSTSPPPLSLFVCKPRVLPCCTIALGYHRPASFLPCHFRFLFPCHSPTVNKLPTSQERERERECVCVCVCVLSTPPRLERCDEASFCFHQASFRHQCLVCLFISFPLPPSLSHTHTHTHTHAHTHERSRSYQNVLHCETNRQCQAVLKEQPAN